MSLIQIFENAGGQFVTSAAEMTEKLKHVKAFLFDWDGVFNTGAKSAGFPNGFTEGDSMGINLLRYEYYLRNGELPLAAIITGEENPTGLDFAKRENFVSVYFKIKNKTEALEHFCQAHNLQPENIAWFFDDVLDLNVARQCGVRMYLAHASQPLTNGYVVRHQMADYISGHEGGQNGLRECCELIMALNGNFDEVLHDRLTFAPTYAEYFSKRLEIAPAVYRKVGDTITTV